MFVLQEDSFDDLLRGVLTHLLEDGVKTIPSKGPARETIGAALTLNDPRARLSRSENRSVAISALGELLWYLSGSDSAEPIGYYIPFYRQIAVDGRIEGGYGSRLLGESMQLRSVLELLRVKRDSRRAVIQIYDETDLNNVEDVPCTCVLQFFARDERLHMITYMRSNDAFKGLPHDIFCFTMIQEIVARSIGIELGSYTHLVGSLHLYEANDDAARAFLGEGWHNKRSMPAMPSGDPWPDIRQLLALERQVRQGEEPSQIESPYWRDLATLLRAFRASKEADPLAGFIPQLTDKYYELFISDRQMKEGER